MISLIPSFQNDLSIQPAEKLSAMTSLREGRDNSASGTTVLMVCMVAGEHALTTVPFSVAEDHDKFVPTKKGRLESHRWSTFARGDA